MKSTDLEVKDASYYDKRWYLEEYRGKEIVVNCVYVLPPCVCRMKS